MILIGQWLAFSTTGGHASRCLSLLGQAMRTAQVCLLLPLQDYIWSDALHLYRSLVSIKCRAITRKCLLLILLILLDRTASNEKELFVYSVSSSSSTTCRRLLDSNLTYSILCNVSFCSRSPLRKTGLTMKLRSQARLRPLATSTLINYHRRIGDSLSDRGTSTRMVRSNGRNGELLKREFDLTSATDDRELC